MRLLEPPWLEPATPRVPTRVCCNACSINSPVAPSPAAVPMDFEQEGASDHEASESARTASGQGAEDGAASRQPGTASGQEFECGGAGLDDDDTRSQASTVHSLSHLPIIMPSNPPVCFMCSQRADAPSPLLSSKGYRPWASHNKVIHGPHSMAAVSFRKPAGRLCAICRNVYRAGGFGTRHVTLANYKKLMSKKDGKQLHADFLAALKEWIQQHNENPEQTKLKSKRRLSDVQSSLTVERELGGKFKAPKTEFVLVDSWDPKEDGEFDESKVVEEKVFGKLHRGIWVLKGKKGRFEFEEHDSTLTRETQVEEEGTGSLVEMAIEAKKEVPSSALQCKLRAKNACIDRRVFLSSWIHRNF